MAVGSYSLIERLPPPATSEEVQKVDPRKTPSEFQRFERYLLSFISA